MQILMSRLRRFGQTVGPYLMLEILLPGGTLLALLLFLCQRRKFNIGRFVSRTAPALTRAFENIVGQGIFVLRPCYLRPRLAFHPGANDGSQSSGRMDACRSRMSQYRVWAPPYDYTKIRYPQLSTTIRSEP